ncbi:ATP-binding protein [Magnetospirillum sp. 64-120]|uniref:ATP-binding protein n=1 Tax=Magnetospirillum sp. 64-120 TaxID=1895778 RepID=UPI0025BE1B75|nr:ATP-binding protein [Magnetospirillum sp. 64-120]
MNKSGKGWLHPSRSRMLAAMASLCLLMPQVVTGYEIWRQHTSTLGLAERNINVLVDLMSGEVQRTLNAVDEIIDQTTLDISTHADRDAVETRRVMRERAMGVPAIFGLMVVDDKGMALASLHGFSPRHQSFADRVRREAQASGRPFHIGRLTPDPFDGTPVIPFARFRHDAQGEIDGLTIASMSARFFRELFAQIKSLPHATITLAQLDGTPLVQIPESDGSSLSPLPEFQPFAADAGLLYGGDKDGKRIVAYRTVRPFALRLTVAVDADELLAPWRSNSLRLILADLTISILLAFAMLQSWRGWRAEMTQDKTREEEELLLRMSRFALNNSADMVVWSDEQGAITFANLTAHQRLGYAPDAMVGLHVADIDPAFHAAMWPEKMDELRKARSLRFDSTLRDRNGAVIPVEVSVSLFSWANQDFACALIRDISERKKTEDTLAERTRRLEASNTELEEFAYVASHDLREPLRMVNAFIGLLERRYGPQLDDTGREYVAFARDGAQRMDRLILDLLEYSRVGAESRPLGVIDLTRSAEAARRDLSMSLQESGAILEMPDEFPMVWGDQGELTRLLVNLIGNAIKYHHPDRAPHIRIAVETGGGLATCRVEDNGIGISPQYFDRIFRIFQRLHGRESYDGTGIGLAVCKKIVERHGGRIWLASVPDQGTTFFFTLRLASEF